jgi:carbon-monoxide dehydrogenase small subunit
MTGSITNGRNHGMSGRMNEVVVNATVNGQPVEVTVEARLSLADALRDNLNLTGTHLGCEHGVCGACTVLVDGEPARSCLMLAVQADGTDITTIEGLASTASTGAETANMHPIQEAMYEAMSFQCAFCSPGFIMTTVALLADNPDPTEEEIREELGGNICRCTGYQSIINGVLGAAVKINQRGRDDNA